jgi:nicotinamidase-related amidase
MTNLDIRSKTTALLIMDCQEAILSSIVPQEREKLLTNLLRAIKAARTANIPIIFVVAKFREGYPEISEKNNFFKGVKENNRLREEAPDSKICQEISLDPGSIVVVKKRFSAFSGSDLEEILRSIGVDTLILTGVSTLGVVESTARFAFDRDYRIIVLGDCCSDRVPEAHNIALKWVLPRISTVASVSDFENATTQSS